LPSQTAPAVPVDRQLPSYPDTAGAAEGYVKLHFTIAKDGHVTDPSVVESSPPGLFDAAAVAGLKQWSYRPRLVDGRPVDQLDNMILVHFKPPENAGPVWLNPEAPMYPQQAFEAKIEGQVKVGFDITETGGDHQRSCTGNDRARRLRCRSDRVHWSACLPDSQR
jgi:TonB family protein